MLSKLSVLMVMTLAAYAFANPGDYNSSGALPATAVQPSQSAYGGTGALPVSEARPVYEHKPTYPVEHGALPVHEVHPSVLPAQEQQGYGPAAPAAVLPNREERHFVHPVGYGKKPCKPKGPTGALPSHEIRPIRPAPEKHCRCRIVKKLRHHEEKPEHFRRPHHVPRPHFQGALPIHEERPVHFRHPRPAPQPYHEGSLPEHEERPLHFRPPHSVPRPYREGALPIHEERPFYGPSPRGALPVSIAKRPCNCIKKFIRRPHKKPCRPKHASHAVLPDTTAQSSYPRVRQLPIAEIRPAPAPHAVLPISEAKTPRRPMKCVCKKVKRIHRPVAALPAVVERPRKRPCRKHRVRPVGALPVHEERPAYGPAPPVGALPSETTKPAYVHHQPIGVLPISESRPSYPATPQVLPAAEVNPSYPESGALPVSEAKPAY